MQMESELLKAQRRRQVLQLKEDKGLAGTKAARRAGQPVQAAPRAGQPGQAAPGAGLQDRAAGRAADGRRPVIQPAVPGIHLVVPGIHLVELDIHLTDLIFIRLM